MIYSASKLNELITASTSRLDESDFILICSRFIEVACSANNETNIFLLDIKHLYLQQSYQEAIAKILIFCKKNESILGEGTVSQLVTSSSTLVSNPKENDSRRLYETLYANVLEDAIKQENDFSMFNELIESYQTIKPEYAESYTPPITNAEEAKRFILSFLMLNDNVELGLKAESTLYKTKDRSRKELGTALSSNPGIMRASAPNFQDNLIPTKAVERIDIDETVADGYSQSHSTTPFLASLSGTTYSLVVVLKDYIEHHESDDHLDQKINGIVNLWIASYIQKGYHSYREIVDVLTEPIIQEIFDDAKVKLNFGVLLATDEIFQQTQDYAIACAMKRLINDELKEARVKLKSSVCFFQEATPDELETSVAKTVLDS
jgi:hypothetical protein